MTLVLYLMIKCNQKRELESKRKTLKHKVTLTHCCIIGVRSGKLAMSFLAKDQVSRIKKTSSSIFNSPCCSRTSRQYADLRHASLTKSVTVFSDTKSSDELDSNFRQMSLTQFHTVLIHNSNAMETCKVQPSILRKQTRLQKTCNKMKIQSSWMQPFQNALYCHQFQEMKHIDV